MLVSGLLLAVLGLLLLLVPAWAGWISGGLWLVFVLAPLLGYLRVNRLFYQERYQQARQLAAYLRWLHPADGWLEYPELLRGMELGYQGKIAEARQIIERYRTNSTTTGRIANTLIYRLNARWPELLNWIRQNWTEETVFRDPVIGTYYLRSLGETGDLNGLLQGLRQFEPKLEKANDIVNLNLVRMFALAFCGQTEAVQQLFQGPLAVYSRNTRQFWLATAELAAGRVELARNALVSLQQHCDPATRQAIAWRLAQPRLDPERELTAASQQILAQTKTVIQQEARYGSRFAFTSRKAYATYGLIALNLVVFGLEMVRGGSENLETLYQMGALVPENVVAGEWWRLLSAIFLHYGVVHIFANMLGLYVLGLLVEAILGSGKFLLLYFFSGIGSMVAIAVLALLLQVPGLIGVGASGAIMGLLGAMAAILLKGWRQDKAKVAAKRLRLILLIVGLQVLSDIFTPQVSLVGHASGLVLGFLAGSLLFKLQDLDRFAQRSSLSK
ncbi:MAG: hypothetical protein Kow00121_01050 [Elainellaceae cyanobacterium]